MHHSSSEDANSYLSSGTSSYESDNDQKMKTKVAAVQEEELKDGDSKALVDKQLMEMMDEFDEPSANSYAKFKTQHEIDPD